ncbi:hypothetical protein B5S29_g1595 [[Candida] boidinii]|nr:hypothetical protein B5S29_g1595 [[Candida] boidinii]
MLRALGITRNRPDSLSHEERTNRIVQQALEFENALKAMDYVLDDRSSEGIHLISNHNEVAISKLAYGVIQFLEATLGFEPETMKKANNTLIAAGDMCWKEKVKAEGLKLQTSAIYPPGTEWAVTYAESNLLSALLMLLSESVVESAKALLKLRRAYHSLDEISKKMEKYNSDINFSLKNKSSSIVSIGVKQSKQIDNDIDNDIKTPSIQINRSQSSNNMSTSAASIARSPNPNPNGNGNLSINSNSNTPRSNGINGGTTNNSNGYTSDRSRSGSVSSSNSSNFQDAKSTSLKRDSSNASLNSSDSYASSAFTSSTMFSDIPIQLTDQQRKDTDMLKKLEKIYQMRKERIYGEHIGNPPVKDSLRTELGYKESSTAENANNNDGNEIETEDQSMEIDIDKLSKKFEDLTFNIGDPEISTIDEFIHSGVNLCFGILQVVLSLIPPAIGKVLSVVGFKGSREVGLQMVWKAAAERNIHGGIGLLALLVFYDGPFQFTDVDFDVPSTEELEKARNKISRTTTHNSIGSTKSSKSSKSHLSKKLTITSVNSQINDGSDLKKTITRQKMQMESNAVIGAGEPTVLHPGAKLVAALLHSRAMFPNSALWLLQESRMLASRGRLEEAIDLMDTAERSEMKQVDALLIFDKAMVLVFLHKYERAAKELLFLVELNAWSHSLYTFFAGVCYAEAYRMCKMGLTIKGGIDNVDPLKENWYKKRAEECIIEAPTLVGKKKFLSKPMPFERFVLRKYDNLIKVKEETGLDLIDCINCSIAHELAYFWNGYNRMPEEHLKLSIKLLGYSANPDCKYASLNPETGKSYSKIKETREESFLRYTLTSISLRRLGLIDEGIKMIDDKVIKYLFENNKIDNSNRFNKLTENPWVYPTSCYERSLFTWKSQGVDGLDEAKEWLKRALAIGGDDYELSTRVGMKIKAALDRLEGL